MNAVTTSGCDKILFTIEVLFSEAHSCHIRLRQNLVENTVAEINSAAVKTKLLELLEKHLRLEDSFYAKFLIDSGSAFDIIDRNF